MSNVSCFSKEKAKCDTNLKEKRKKYTQVNQNMKEKHSAYTLFITSTTQEKPPTKKKIRRKCIVGKSGENRGKRVTERGKGN